MWAKFFSEYYWATVVRPGKAFKDLIADSRSLKFSALAVLITAVLYTFVYIFLILGGGEPFKPWLNIPLDRYYCYNVFFCGPSMFLGWILAAGVVHSLGIGFHFNGSFERILAVFGFGIGIASWTTGLHDFITSFLGAIHVIDQHAYEFQLNSPTIWRTLLWIQMLAYLVWFIVLFSVGVKSVYQIKTGQAILLGVLGFIIYQSFFLIFNR
jgi:hypothetical protein